MIETLRIENVAIVETAELEFGSGLNVLTGETGAGKSIVLGALSLLAGARASAESVRTGSDEAVVEAVFGTAGLDNLVRDLEKRGFSTEEDELVVRRTVSKAGRSRGRLGGELVPASVLAELFAGRIEISSQHDSQNLRRAEVHGNLLDRRGGLQSKRDAVAEGYARLRQIDDDLERLRRESLERVQRSDFLSFQIREIDDAKLDPAELERIVGERSRLAHAERLGDGGGQAQGLLAGDPMRAEDPNAADLVAEATRRLEAMAQLDPTLAEMAERCATAQAELRELGLELERYLGGVEVDPARLGDIDERLHRVEGLQRKYGAGPEEILAFREHAAAELANLEGADARVAELEAEREPCAAELDAAAATLSEGRGRAGRGLARKVQSSLRELAMPSARFNVGLDPVAAPEGFPCGPGGREAPEFQLSANPGEDLRPLRKVASGGELSRAFLAIKNATRGAAEGMVIVFDEVDAGVGGAAADAVGRALAELAAHHQILCITHLPQIAAFADTHFRVEKKGRGGRTRARIDKIEGPERVEEIARMAGGDSVGEATRAHARELLGARGRPAPPHGD